VDFVVSDGIIAGASSPAQILRSEDRAFCGWADGTMERIKVICPKCSAQYSVDAVHLGKPGHCKRCNSTFVIEKAAESSAPNDRPASRQPREDAPAKDELPGLWRLGDVILDVYEVKRLNEADKEKHYAEGGMGVVYRVHHRGWDLDLAVKSPKPETFETERGKENFERECQTWIELGLHPNIVSCYYVRRLDGIPRVFAEFVEGGTLSDWIGTKKLYEGGPEESLPRILDIAIQFAWGLHHAHEQGLIHQDVKPGNVMMHGSVPKVTDFGLAKARLAAGEFSIESMQGSLSVSWGGMTPGYCSPEQVEAAVQVESGVPHQQRTKLTRRTDIWSWAVSVLEMFYGKPPCRYGGHTAARVLRTYLDEAPAGDLLPRMPDSLAGLLRRCFKRKPENRPADMQEITEELKEVYRQVTGGSYPRKEPARAELKADGLNNRAASLLDLGKKEEAERLLAEAWQRHPWQPQVTHNRGLLLWRTGRITDLDLITHLEELCTTRPQSWEAAYSLGLAQLERGDVKPAVEALQRAADLGGAGEVCTTLQLARSLLTHASRCVRSFIGQPPYLTSVFLSADDRWALSGIDDKTLRVWDVATGRSVLTVDVPAGDPPASSLSADGRWELSATGDETLQLSDITAGRRATAFHKLTWGPSSDVRSADGRWRLSAGEGYLLELREGPTDKLVRTFRGHTGPVNSVFLSPDGRWVLSGSGDKTVRLWNVASGQCLRTLKGHTRSVNSVFLSADGRWALSASIGRTLRLWNLEMLSGAKRRFVAPLLLCHVTSSEEASRAQARFADLCTSARAAIANNRYDAALGLVRTARSLPGYELARESLDLWTRIGNHSVRTQSLHAWCVQTFDGHVDDVRSVALSADARWALSGSADKTLRLWQVDKGRSTKTLQGHTDCVSAVDLSADARRAVSGSWDKTLKLWDLASGRCLRTFQGHTSCVNSVRLSADGRLALSGSWDKTLRLWDVASGRCLRTFEGHTNYVDSVFLSADARLALSGSEDNTLRLWSATTGRCLRTFKGHTDWVHSAFLTADGRWALSAGKDWTVRLWEVATGTCLRVFKGHDGPVTSVFLSADGRWALSGSRDETVRLWELATGRCVQTFEGHTDWVHSVFLSPDGRWALSGSKDCTLRLWELDWDLEFPGWADWDEGARSCLETFLTLHCPYDEDGINRTGEPQFSDEDFGQLLAELGHRGFGWLRPEGVRKQLDEMAEEWLGPPLLPDPSGKP